MEEKLYGLQSLVGRQRWLLDFLQTYVLREMREL